ncbi:hypothetical protein VHEMI06003 [[Torrubiella] hemipterigena]|uniref:Uncharacterized protein n=1 Tax=[Torrubiella] hemipterigena TaxID=1531966 RepID=A0A0A1T5Y8_9HYPO|nr:hypothetical protein VHEMI06003 [[Torrubiella] hemipterigena]
MPSSIFNFVRRGRKSSSSERSSSRSSSTSSSADMSTISDNRRSYASSINSIIFNQPSMIDHAAELENFSSELTVLEPRPVVYWSSVEERMGSLNF